MNKYKNNLSFNLELTRLNFQSAFVTMLYYCSNDISSELFATSLIILKDTLINNYPGQSMLFRGECKGYFENLMLDKKIDVLLLIKEIFYKDPLLLFVSPGIFLFNILLY